MVMRNNKMLWIVGALALPIITAQVVLGVSRNPEDAGGPVVYARGDVPSLAAQMTPWVPPALPRTDVITRADGRVVTVTDSLSDADLPPMLKHIEGIPAIEPSVLNAKPDAAAFTEMDVHRFHKLGGALGAGLFPSLVPTKIEKIEFVTVQALQSRDSMLLQMVDDLGLPDNTLLCVVQYSGSFIERTLPGSRAHPTRPYAMVLFDAHNGNMYMSNTLDALK